MMTAEDDALERRVMVLLGHLEEMPAIEAALPLTVKYLIGEIRRVVQPIAATSASAARPAAL